MAKKTPKYPKVRENCQIVAKVPFFDVLAIGNSNAFGWGDQAIKKVNFDRIRNFGQKKISNQSPLQSRPKMTKKHQNTEKLDKWSNSNKCVIF